ncbi:hypothetical protein Tco_0652025 [Tanacetum coccineum]|uniref:Uncharacterized protein n=1 Tax=Tanacetum coccineum TaxID=301880 RepID=A0ABQ4WX46_9ASTR
MEVPTLPMIYLSVDAQAKEIGDLKKRVQNLERKKKSRTIGLQRLRKVSMSRRVESSEDKESLGDHEDASNLKGGVLRHCKGCDVSLVDDNKVRPKARGVVVQEPSEFRTPQESQPSMIKDKGKAIMIEPEVPLKRKYQVAFDEDLARNFKSS